MPDQVTWDDTQPCQVCEGRGWVPLEDPHPGGVPGWVHTIDDARDWETCGYCHGTGHSAWVAEKRLDRQARSKRTLKWLVIITVILLMSNQHPVSPLVNWVKLCLWLPLLGYWLWWAVNRPVSQRAKRRAQKRAQHAPGFSDHKETLALGALIGGAFAKAAYTRHKAQHTDGFGRHRFDLDD